MTYAGGPPPDTATPVTQDRASGPAGEGPTGQAVLGDGAVAAVAVAAALGAWTAREVPAPLLLAVGAAALVRRRPVLLALAVGLLAGVLSARAWAGLDPATGGAVSGAAVLVSDPERLAVGTRALARFDGQRVELRAYGSTGAALRRGLAGDVVELEGSRHPRSAADIAANPWRRVVGRVEVATVHGVRPGAWPFRLANEVHRRLDRGARSLPDERRALLAGLVLGDDRAQPARLRDAFDVAGLSHLLAVSGQNVAFVLAAAGPFLFRLRRRARFAAVIGLLAFFATVTRFEPSVLRAVAMAGLAAAATAVGRPASGVRTLALASTGLLLVDPLLVRSLGFQLSVLASGGILVLAPRMVHMLPLPIPLATAVSVTVAAQLATAPLLVTRFGGIPLVAVPANVAIGPAAGLVMTWGSSAGLLAGFLPERAAAVVHLPTTVLLWWIEQVAYGAAGVPPLVLRAPALLVGVAAAAAMVTIGARRRGVYDRGHIPADIAGTTGGPGAAPVRRPARHRTIVVVALVVGLLCDRSPPPVAALPAGAALYRSGVHEVLVLSRPVDGARLLRSLRGRVDGPLDLLVVASPSGAAWRAADAVIDGHDPPLVLTGGMRDGAVRVDSARRHQLGPLEVLVVPSPSAGDGRLRVDVSGGTAEHDVRAAPPLTSRFSRAPPVQPGTARSPPAAPRPARC